VGIINHGKIIIVDKKDELIKKLGQKKLIIELQEKIKSIPDKLEHFDLVVNKNLNQITYTYDTKNERTGITELLNLIKSEGLVLKDLNTEKSSLESIFINLVRRSK